MIIPVLEKLDEFVFNQKPLFPKTLCSEYDSGDVIVHQTNFLLFLGTALPADFI